MKTKYKYQISAFFLGLIFLTGCAEFEEYESADLGTGPDLTVSLKNAGDSLITVDFTSTAAGYIAAVLMTDTSNAIPEDPESLAQGDIINDEYFYAEVDANETVSYTFTNDVIQDAMYEIMAVAANGNGILSEVEVLEVETIDTYAPGLVAVYPAFSYDPVVKLKDTIVLEFVEPVTLGDGKFTFQTFNEGQSQEVPAANLSASGNAISIIIPFTPANGDYLWLSWEEGAVEDLSGNAVAALTTALDGGEFVGAYWRIVFADFDFKTVMPNQAEDQDPGFDMTFTYDSTVSFATSQGVPVIEDGDITLTYNDSETGNTLIVGVPVADVNIDEKDLIITQANAPVWFGTVTVDIPEGLFNVGYGNPMVEVSETWKTKGEHPLEAWIGTYSVAAVSYVSPGAYDEAWTVTTAPVAGDETKLSCTGIAYGDVAVIATLDKVNMTITFPGGALTGSGYGYGATEIWHSDLVTTVEEDVVGTISADGGITVDEMGIILADYGNYVWDAFNTTWTKGAKKSASAANFVDRLKIQ